MLPYGGRVSERAVCLFRRGVASSEAEARGAIEGLGGEPSSEEEIALRVRGGLEGHVASPDPFLSRRWVRGHTRDEVESGRPELAG